MNKKYVYLLIISGILICLDQVTKLYVHTQFHLGESTVIIKNFFNITYVRNFGAAFGFLANSHPEFREIFFLVMPPLAVITIFFILRGVQDSDRIQVTALSCIFGGAIGNYIDRLRFRYVIDFIDFHLYEKYSWPAFNIADSAIVVGVIMLVIMMALEGRQQKNQTSASESSPTVS